MLLHETHEKNQSAGGYTSVSMARDVIKSADQEFNPKTYGYSSLYRLIEAFPQKYEFKRHGPVYSYRCIEEKKQTPLLGKCAIASRTREILRSLIADGAIIAEGCSKNKVFKRSV